MPRTIEGIVHPDGSIELLEPVAPAQPRRVLITILDEPPVAPPASHRERGDAILIAAGLVRPRAGLFLSPAPTPADLAAAARTIPPGTPLSQIVIADREDRA